MLYYVGTQQYKSNDSKNKREVVRKSTLNLPSWLCNHLDHEKLSSSHWLH